MPGCNDVVRHGWNGLLVPPRDPEKLAAAVLRLAASPEERQVMGSRSRAHVIANFSLSYVAEAYAGIYERVLRDPQTSAPCRAAS
jgi:glycosyltransferase involved in cell wall biosynthesis